MVRMMNSASYADGDRGELPALPPVERCQVAAMLTERWSGERPGGWRAWNLGDARARRMVAEFSAPAECASPAGG
jgi:hypothetical protein